MAATILNSPRAVAMSVYVVRAFVKMRQELLTDATLEKRLATIEKTLIGHDTALRDLYQKIRPLLLPPLTRLSRASAFIARGRNDECPLSQVSTRNSQQDPDEYPVLQSPFAGPSRAEKMSAVIA